MMVIDNTVLHFMRDYILRKHLQAVCCSDYLYFKYCKLYEIETRLSNEKRNQPICKNSFNIDASK